MFSIEIRLKGVFRKYQPASASNSLNQKCSPNSYQTCGFGKIYALENVSNIKKTYRFGFKLVKISLFSFTKEQIK